RNCDWGKSGRNVAPPAARYLASRAIGTQCAWGNAGQPGQHSAHTRGAGGAAARHAYTGVGRAMNPLSAFYGAITDVRNSFYDRGVFKAHSLKYPVISIGNLSIGGSGKTPFVIKLGKLLLEHGLAIDVLSRGYRRRTKGVLQVDPGGIASTFGDEP